MLLRDGREHPAPRARDPEQCGREPRGSTPALRHGWQGVMFRAGPPTVPGSIPLMAPTDEISIRELRPTDRAAWEPLWRGYQEFYEATIAEEVTDTTWSRFHDPAEPMFALGAFLGDPDATDLAGIVHCIYHRSCWTEGDYCYLQDLFTRVDARGGGVGRALIEAVYARAKAHGAARVHWLTQETNAAGRALYDKVANRSGFIQYRKVL